MTTVNVLKYGAKGDGRTDDSAAFQKAEDYLSTIASIINPCVLYVPAGIYIISKAFYHKSFIWLVGDGDKSIIRNKSTNKGPDQFCIYVGNFAPTTFSECAHFFVNDIKAGDNKVTFRNKANAANFRTGQTILIDSTAGFMSDDGHWKPYAAFINRVVAIDTVNGIITLEDAVSIDITGANIAPDNMFLPGTKNDKSYICQNATIKDIRFESLGDWTMRFGCYKVLFENISLKTTDAIGGNGFSHCTFKNIRAEFSQKVIEMAMYSHDSIVDGMVATWFNGAIDPAMKPLLKMGENMRNCSFNNLTIDSGQGKNFGMAIRFEHAFNNKITNSTFKCPTIAQNGIELTTSDANAFVQNNEVSGNTFTFGGSDSYINLKDSNPNLTNMNDNKIINNTFSGACRKAKAILSANWSNITSPNTFK